MTGLLDDIDSIARAIAVFVAMFCSKAIPYLVSGILLCSYAGWASAMVGIHTKRGTVEVLDESYRNCKNPDAPKRAAACEDIALNVAKADRVAALPYAIKACRFALDDLSKPSLASCAPLWNFLDITSLSNEDRALAESAAKRFLDSLLDGSIPGANSTNYLTTTYVLSVRFPDQWASYMEKLVVKEACIRSGAFAEILGGEAPCERAGRMGISINPQLYAGKEKIRQYEIDGITNILARAWLMQNKFSPECVSRTETSLCHAHDQSLGGALDGESVALQFARSNPSLAAKYAYATCLAAIRDESVYSEYCAALWSFAGQSFIDAEAHALAEKTARLYLRTKWKTMMDISIHAPYTLLMRYPALFREFAAAKPIAGVCESGDDRQKFDEYYGIATSLGESACSRAAKLKIEINEAFKAALAKIDADYEREAKRELAVQRAKDSEFRQQMIDTIITGINQTTSQLQHQNAAVTQQQQLILQQQALRDHERIEQKLESAAAVSGSGRTIGGDPALEAQRIVSTCNSRCASEKNACDSGSQSACYRAAACQCQCFLDEDTTNSPARGQWRQCVADNTAKADQLKGAPTVISPNQTTQLPARRQLPPSGSQYTNCDGTPRSSPRPVGTTCPARD
jgi:hypothetical protein